MKLFKQIGITLVSTTLLIASCKKPIENPKPEEQELITTLRLIVTNDSGFNKTFNYKIDNGFGSATPGNVKIDDIMLAPTTQYKVEVKVLDESKSPADDITEEVIAESHHHLFVYESSSGSLIISNGNKDYNGQPFNQKVTLTTGVAGNGNLTITLKHEPTNKNATTADGAGGETDVLASFPVKIQ